MAPPSALPHPSKAPRDRWEAAPAAARARGPAGNQRLYRRWETFTERKRRTTVANVAVARELAGWCWSLARLLDQRKRSSRTARPAVPNPRM